MYYRIFSVRKAVYGVDDLHASISNVAQAELKVIFGSMSFTEALTSQDKVNELAMSKLNKDFVNWGVECTRLEILNITPPNDITNRLRQQMLAERKRRAEFVIAEGKKSAMRLRSEGTKIMKFQMGVAQQEAKRKRSEGKAESTVRLAQAESAALRAVQQALEADGCSQTDYKVAQAYLSMFADVSSRIKQKEIYLPYAAHDLKGDIVRGIPQVFGRYSDAVARKRVSARGAGTASSVHGKTSDAASKSNAGGAGSKFDALN